MKAAVVVLLLAACGDNLAGDTVLPEVSDPVALVDPTIGTGGLGFAFGSCFVGAAVPHGLVKLGPDTNGPYGTVGFLHYSGYFAEDDRIQGFSHLHLHGTGATDYGVLSLMPVTAFDASKTSVVDYQAKFAKEDEHASAGKYAVSLANGIGVELSATQRAGVHHYTVGQRKGLGIAAKEPLYVIATEPASQRVIVGGGDALLRTQMAVKEMNWISVAPITSPVRATVRIRNKHLPAPATITPTSDPSRVDVRFDDPQRAITPGQGAVMYDGEIVLGGGWID